MRELAGSRAIVTGASRGLGAVIADTLASRGVELVLAARNEHDLENVRARVAQHGSRVAIAPTDVADRTALERLVERARSELGGIDLLVNNAGVEMSGYYEDLSLDELDQLIDINLRAPMLLTRIVLPEMLAANRGHVVNIASLAGLGPYAFGEPYGATKAGVVGFTRSLRAGLKARGSAVSASAICPSFVRDTGMYARGRDKYGINAPGFLATTSPRAVARAVVRAIEHDEGERIVNGLPLRPFLAFGTLAPDAVEWLAVKLKANEPLRAIAERRREERRNRR